MAWSSRSPMPSLDSFRELVTVAGMISTLPIRPSRFGLFAERQKDERVTVGTATLGTMLVVIPCSKSKKPGGAGGRQGHAVVDSLPPLLARDLATAREKNADLAKRGNVLMPALTRYAGTLYGVAHEPLRAIVSSGAHVLILSGGYGVVCAHELIADYEMRFKPALWPNRIVERTLEAYAARHGCLSVRAFAGGTTSYAQVMRRTRWQGAGVRDAVLVAPAFHRGGAMRAVPTALGAAITALSEGSLTPQWRTTDGIGFSWERL